MQFCQFFEEYKESETRVMDIVTLHLQMYRPGVTSVMYGASKNQICLLHALLTVAQGRNYFATAVEGLIYPFNTGTKGGEELSQSFVPKGRECMGCQACKVLLQ